MPLFGGKEIVVVKKKRTPKNSGTSKSEPSEKGGKKKSGRRGRKTSIEEESSSVVQAKSPVGKNGVTTPTKKSLSAEQMNAMTEFLKHATETEPQTLRDEFTNISTMIGPIVYYKNPATEGKNRYPEIPCIEATRVVLEPGQNVEGGYIHANKISLEKIERTFIATQGPKEDTIEDFWRMIYQESCVGIVLLSNFEDDGIPKCEQFWPFEKGAYKYYGKYFVNNRKVEHFDQYDVYTIEVLPDGCSNSILTQLAVCTVWPDKMVPRSERMVLRMIQWMNALDYGPVVLTGSAGVGRAGTFLAIETVRSRLLKGLETKVKDVVIEIRKQRAGAISNGLQYMFIYVAVLSYIRAKLPKLEAAFLKFNAGLNDLKSSSKE